MRNGQGSALWGTDPLAMLGEIELERLRSSLERRMFRMLGRRSVATVGRFEILEKLGRGGMGMVYAARDPDLCRLVALKVLRQDRQDDRSSRRMMREARSLARLKHPNVVEVYDVGHTVSGEFFIAMEYIRGPTLRQWLVERKRSRSEILEQFGAVGRGLAAAHAAGVVHRDFKPENVIIASDGRPRVLDFGLADGPHAAAANAPTLDAAEPQRETFANGTADDSMSGGSDDLLVGTPAYMAPEQLDGERVDPRADQYAFCVALHEALLGHRPFAAASIAELRSRIRDSDRPSIGYCQLPRRLAKALMRGLSRHPNERFPSLTALLDALEAARRPALAPVMIGATVVCVAALLGVWRNLGVAPHPLCDADAPSSQHGQAERWYERWEEERTAACGNAAPESSAALDCLHALRRDLDASIVPAEDGATQSTAVDAFPDPRICRPSISESSRALLVRVARLRSMVRSDMYDATVAFGHELLAECRRLSDRLLESEAALLLAQFQLAHGAQDEAEALYRESYFAATEVDHHENALRAAAALAVSLAHLSGQHTHAMQWLRHTESHVRLAGLDAHESGELLLARVAVLGAHPQADKAFAALQTFDTAKPPLPPGLRSQLERERGRLLLAHGQSDAGERALLDAVDWLGRQIGPSHPRVADLAERLAEELTGHQRWDGAVVLLERALRIRTRGHATMSDLARADTLRLVELELLRHRPEAAAHALESARDASEPSDLVSLRELDGRISAQLGNHASAVAHFRAALHDASNLPDRPPHPDLHARLAVSLARMDMVAEAFKHARAAMDLARTPGQSPVALARAASALGDVTLQSGRPHAAIAPLRMAVTLFQSSSPTQPEPADYAQARFLLGQALALSHAAPDEARAMLDEASHGFREVGWGERASAVQAWSSHALP